MHKHNYNEKKKESDSEVDVEVKALETHVFSLNCVLSLMQQ